MTVEKIQDMLKWFFERNLIDGVACAQLMNALALLNDNKGEQS